MKHTVDTSWKGNMLFDANVSGYHVMMDAVAAVGGKIKAPGPRS